MALPMNQTPTYTLTIPSTGKDAKFKPFVVKQEKALLLAMQSESEMVMLDTLKGVIQDCFVDKIDVERLATFDVEYIFAQLRARSVGEIIEIILKCDECEDDKAKVKINLNVDHIKVQKPETHSTKIHLFDDVGVVMKYPSFSIVEKLQGKNQKNVTPDDMFDIIVECMDMIFDTSQTYPINEQPREEVMTFLDNLTNEQFEKIQQFFETMPKMTHDVEFDCPVCNKHHQKKMEGLQSFFS
jgi:hypothetical protein